MLAESRGILTFVNESQAGNVREKLLLLPQTTIYHPVNIPAKCKE